jgi:hypothetical protein
MSENAGNAEPQLGTVGEREAELGLGAPGIEGKRISGTGFYPV